MSQIEPLSPVNPANPGSAEQTVVSPAVAEVLERTHRWAMLELERFTAAETNPFFYYLRGVNNTIASILGKEIDPADFSRIISLKKQLRDQEAANETVLEKAA